MQKKHKPKGLRATKCFAALLGMAALLSHTTLADTVYRCGEAYSSSNQCASGTAKEVKPSAVLHTTEANNANAATRDLRDAQALEKQRLQAEQQATQAAPIRLSTPRAPSTAPLPSSVTHTEQNASKGNRREKGQGKHTRKPNKPYFTAVDPTAAPKKKSTATAVPASSTP
jgi:hypothetical protein